MSLLLRMLLNYKYEILDQLMSDSNIGGRRNRGIGDHLFIANGSIDEHKTPKQIQLHQSSDRGIYLHFNLLFLLHVL